MLGMHYILIFRDQGSLGVFCPIIKTILTIFGLAALVRHSQAQKCLLFNLNNLLKVSY